MSTLVRMVEPTGEREVALRMAIGDFSECPECGTSSVYLAARAHCPNSDWVEVGICCTECRTEPDRYPSLVGVSSWLDVWRQLVAAYDDMSKDQDFVDYIGVCPVEAFAAMCGLAFGGFVEESEECC